MYTLLASVNLSVVPLADDVVVNGAKLENGMLYIALERIIPEEKKPKIAIEHVAE